MKFLNSLRKNHVIKHMQMVLNDRFHRPCTYLYLLGYAQNSHHQSSKMAARTLPDASLMAGGGGQVLELFLQLSFNLFFFIKLFWARKSFIKQQLRQSRTYWFRQVYTAFEVVQSKNVCFLAKNKGSQVSDGINVTLH